MRTTTLILLVGLAAGSAQAAGIELAIQTPRPGTGEYYIAVHDRADTFPGAEQAHAARARVIGASQTVAVEVPDGRYAIAVYQDLNGNGRLDSNLVGIPTEPVGFSRNARGSMGPPKFDDAAVDVNGEHRLDIQLTD
ncbi:MAG: DUF2141 domain-containing protein [Gammaproteobacteria bacterium]|nr:DUF2141 domain-containing protein [Gammaproteobacteria bacterium]